jgi:DNA-binding CsgD family transcriptional regulator/catechol 2,3-dioxygenase-like lactoylglutathione lyase family enzyme
MRHLGSGPSDKESGRAHSLGEGNSTSPGLGSGVGRSIVKPKSVKRPRGRPPHADLLTPGEWRTVHAVQHGMTNAEIARRRGVSVDAVKYHLANALAKLNLSSRHELRQWFRAPNDGAMAASERRNMNAVAKIESIGQIARSVGDIQASEKWYRDVLGLPHLYTFGTLAFFDCGGTRLMLSQEGGAAKESILYLRVADIVAAHQQLQTLGVRFTHAPHMIHRHADGTEEWMAFFEDPDGRPLGLMAQVAVPQ